MNKGRFRTVLAFGTFDIVHPGHVKFLTAAKRLGTRLVVVVTRDDKVLKEKGRRPIMDETERLAIVAALKPVDRAVLGDRVGEWRVTRRLKPTLVAVGYDQKIPPHFPKKIKTCRLPHFSARKHSSTLIKRRIQRTS